MAKPKKKRKLKKRVKLSAKAKLRNKTQQPSDTLRKIEGRPPADVGPTFRVKIRKR